MRVSQRVGANGIVRQRIYALNGPPRMIVRGNTWIRMYVPGQQVKIATFGRPSASQPLDLLSIILSDRLPHYRVTLGPVRRIAARPAQQIVILPDDNLRYGYRLWADEQTGLLLKAAVMTQQQYPIEQYLLTKIEIGGLPSIEAFTRDHDLKPALSSSYGPDRPHGSARGSVMPQPNWSVDELPPGFRLATIRAGVLPLESGIRQQYVFTDGLASVSLFVRSLTDNAGPTIQGLTGIGALHAFGREAYGHQFVVIGEVPPRTVKMIGMSVRSRPASGK